MPVAPCAVGKLVRAPPTTRAPDVVCCRTGPDRGTRGVVWTAAPAGTAINAAVLRAPINLYARRSGPRYDGRRGGSPPAQTTSRRSRDAALCNHARPVQRGERPRSCRTSRALDRQRAPGGGAMVVAVRISRAPSKRELSMFLICSAFWRSVEWGKRLRAKS